MLVPVIQRDPITCLPDRSGWCFSGDLSAVVAGAGLAAVAVLIRSLSTSSGVTHHSPVVAVSSPAGTDLFSAHKEAPSPCLQNWSKYHGASEACARADHTCG